MANGGDRRAYIEPENPVPPRLRGIHTPLRRRRRLYLTEENHSLLNSFRSSAALTPQETATCTQSLFNLMTSNDAAQFRGLISRLDGNNLQRMISLLTSENGRFLQTARNKNGSKSIQELLGKSDDVDTFFFNAIMRRFYDMMNDWDASHVTIKAMRVFTDAKKKAMYDQLLNNAVDLACDPDGYMVLNRIITDWSGLEDFFYRDRLLYTVSLNAHRISDDNYGSYVIQHVLGLNDFRCTCTVAVSLTGHCVNFSSMKCGSYVVEKLLDTEDEAAVMVVRELLLGCDGETLASLAKNQFGNYVVWKALRVTEEMGREDLFRGLVNKLMPFVHLLRRGCPERIGAFLDSLDN